MKSVLQLWVIHERTPRMFNGMTVKARLFFLVCFSVLNVAILGGISCYSLQRTVAKYDHVVETNMKVLEHLNKARNSQRDLVILFAPLLANDEPVPNPEQFKAEYAKSKAAYEEATASYQKLPVVAGEDELRKDVKEGWDAFIDSCEKMMPYIASTSPDEKKIRADFGKKAMIPARKMFRESFAALIDFHSTESQKWAEDARSQATSARTLLIWAAVLGGIAALGLGLRTSTTLSGTLHSIASRIAEAMDKTVTAGKKVATASDFIASASAQQASSLQETAASMEQISSMVARNAEGANSAKSISDESKVHAHKGQEVVRQVVGSMNDINESNQHIGTQIEANHREMSEILKVIGEIRTKTQVINDIVFQTKLLSFNASVEAARAGEQGKGFAVVAEEVGNLAQMSGVAAQSIAEILQNGTQKVEDIIRRSTTEVGRLLDENQAKLTNGVSVVENCTSVFEELAAGVSQVNGVASEIATASQEQANGVKQINVAVNELDGVVQKTNVASQELAMASTDLMSQTDVLNEVVVELFAMVEGKKDGQRAA